MRKGGKFLKKDENSQKKGRKILLTSLGAVAGLMLAAVIWGITYYNSTLNKVNIVDVPKIDYAQSTEAPADAASETTAAAEMTQPHVASSADYINFLVVGQASRAGEAERFADTMILCTVNTHEKTLTMTSLLRDSFVKMPDYRGKIGGRIKLTTIYHLGSTYGDGIAGSMELMNMTLYNNFGIEVDHNVEIDFDAFINVVDLLGGVELELTEAEAKYLNGDDFWVYQDVQPGSQRLDGMTALSYARMRKAEGDGDSDITRTSRQRKLMEALLNKLRRVKAAELQAIANEVLPLISTSMNKSEITEMLLKFLPMLPDLTIQAGGTCPANYKGDRVDIYGDGVMHSVLRFDVDETKKTMRAITEGEAE